MYKVLRPIKDTYITDRYVNGVSQTSCNVGSAGSLDLFKLYGYTTTTSGSYSNGILTSSIVNNTELSRLLIQFDLDPLRKLIAAGAVDPGNSSFSCKLCLYDVYGGQPTPNNFNVAVYPLSASFDEGLGKDVVFYSDQDTCNWLTSSAATGSWVVTGCGFGGDASISCDYITTLSGSSLAATQFFSKGTEDLCVDVTTIVSATLAGSLPDVGLRISFDAPTEANQYTYFVKRFASHTAYNDDKHPKLIVRYDDSIQDDTDNFYLDSTNYLFLYNYERSSPANLTSGSSLTPIIGLDCLQLSLVGEFPSVVPQVVSGSIVLEPEGPFVFVSSNVTFTGIYTGSLNGSGSVINTLVVGSITGTIPSSAIDVPSGSFTLSDGITAALDGTTYFTGTIQGVSGADFYELTGTYTPQPASGTFLFSGTYEASSTLGQVPWIGGPFSASQFFLGNNPQTGIYSASVHVASTDPSLLPQWQFSGSVTVLPIWESLDGTFPYLTGSAIKLFAPQRGTQSIVPKRLVVTVLNVEDSIGPYEETILRVNIFDYTAPYVIAALRLPVELPGIVIRDVHYQVRDVKTDLPAIPFDLETNSTRVSNDSASMYFRLDSSSLTRGRTYVIDVLVVTGNNKQLYKAASPAFRVDATA